MSYWNTSTGQSNQALDNWGIKTSTGGSSGEFYELEPAIVLDIILDKNHPELKNHTIDAKNWPADRNAIEKGFPIPFQSDTDFSWLGKALVRMVHTSKNIEKEQLVWAYPSDANISEYPLVNEVVLVAKYFDRYFYTKKLNYFNFPNNNADFTLELNYGGYITGVNNQQVKGNRETIYDFSNPQLKDYRGPTSTTRAIGGFGYQGAMGRYFFANHRIRSLKRHEGDLVFESRFGQSIRFGAYDDDRTKDKGYDSSFGGYDDYRGVGIKYDFTNPNGTTSSYEAGGGNPMILIRNRQRPLVAPGEVKKIQGYENLPPVVGTTEEKNVGGYFLEDVNNDGSSIHLTSGATISGFKTNCFKKMWGLGEEQPSFDPSGSTSFKYPILNGDQIVINSDRLILSSKIAETFHYSKKRYSVVTDSELTMDANDQIIFTTNNKTVINSPAIYLGEYNATGEPALLGQTTVNWLYELCEWLLAHTHWYKHSHPDAGTANPNVTQYPVEIERLKALRDKLKSLMSRRVFLTGGGFAPGVNGRPLSNNTGTAPTVINVKSGEGVPGGWKGKNKRAKV